MFPVKLQLKCSVGYSIVSRGAMVIVKMMGQNLNLHGQCFVLASIPLNSSCKF